MSCWVTVSLDGFNPVTAVDPRDPNGMLSRLTFGPNIRQQKYRHLHLRSSPELSVIAETTTQCYAKRITCPAANRGRCDENNNESHGHRYTVTLHTWYPLPRAATRECGITGIEFKPDLVPQRVRCNYNNNKEKP